MRSFQDAANAAGKIRGLDRNSQQELARMAAVFNDTEPRLLAIEAILHALAQKANLTASDAAKTAEDLLNASRPAAVHQRVSLPHTTETEIRRILG